MRIQLLRRRALVSTNFVVCPHNKEATVRADTTTTVRKVGTLSLTHRFLAGAAVHVEACGGSSIPSRASPDFEVNAR
jgi:hypothetical protein